MLSVKPWRSEAVIQFIAAQFVCFSLGLVAAAGLQWAGVPAFKSPDSFGVVLCSTLGFQGATWVLIYFFLRQHQVTWRETFGLRKSRWWRALLMALVTALVILPVAWRLEQASELVLEKFGWTPASQTAVTMLAHAKSWWTRVYLGLFAVAIAPVAEEFIFRGVLYPFVKQLGLPRVALFGVSAIFALIHLDVTILVPLFVLALVLTWLYERTDSLLAPIAAHSLFNAANLVVLLFGVQLHQPLQRLYHLLHLT